MDLVFILNSVLGLKRLWPIQSCLFWLMVIQLTISLVEVGPDKEIPSSLSFFCLAEDVLSRSISWLVENKLLKSMATPSHVLYADDIMVIYKSTKDNLQKLMSLFEAYDQISSQHLSLGKCKCFAGSVSSRRLGEISSILGFSQGHFLFTYLGIPIFKGKPKISHLQPITDKIKCKLASWKGFILSIMGKV